MSPNSQRDVFLDELAALAAHIITGAVIAATDDERREWALLLQCGVEALLGAAVLGPAANGKGLNDLLEAGSATILARAASSGIRVEMRPFTLRDRDA